MENKKFTVTVESVSPCCWNKPFPITKNVEDLSHGEISEMRVYRHPNGNVAMPGKWFRGALRSAYINNKVYKNKTNTERMVKARIAVTPNLIDLGIEDYDIDVQIIQLNVRGSITLVTHVRPKIDSWKASFTLTTSLNQTSDEIQKMLELAGYEEGIGTARGEGYGRFKVTNFKPM